jgi:hypothetical protein
MPKASKFTNKQKMEIALELIAGERSMSEICRSYSFSASYANRLRYQGPRCGASAPGDRSVAGAFRQPCGQSVGKAR